MHSGAHIDADNYVLPQNVHLALTGIPAAVQFGVTAPERPIAIDLCRDDEADGL